MIYTNNSLVISPLHIKVEKLLKKYSLEKKFQKQIKILQKNYRHPGLHFELLHPKEHGVYSFRIDKKYRALCIFNPEKQAIEILTITVHYQ